MYCWPVVSIQYLYLCIHGTKCCHYWQQVKVQLFRKNFRYGEMIYQVTIVLFLIWSQFMVALEYFFDVKVIRVCFVDLG